MIKHVVLFAFNNEVKEDEITELHRRFCDLPSQIDLIRSFETGTDISVEGISKGFTHGYVLGFDSTADRDAYIPHPRHKAFSNFAGPLLRDVLVFDYEVETVL